MFSNDGNVVSKKYCIANMNEVCAYHLFNTHHMLLHSFIKKKSWKPFRKRCPLMKQTNVPVAS